MTTTPRKQRKIAIEKDDTIEEICTLSAADIQRVYEAKAKSPRTSVPALASILKLDGEQVKIALKMKKVRKNIDFASDNDDENSKSSTKTTSSSQKSPAPVFDSFDALFQFDSAQSTSFTYPKASTSSHKTDDDDGNGSDNHSVQDLDMAVNVFGIHCKFSNISQKNVLLTKWRFFLTLSCRTLYTTRKTNQQFEGMHFHL